MTLSNHARMSLVSEARSATDRGLVDMMTEQSKKYSDLSKQWNAAIHAGDYAIADAAQPGMDSASDGIEIIAAEMRRRREGGGK